MLKCVFDASKVNDHSSINKEDKLVGTSRKPWEYEPGVSVHRIREDTKAIWRLMPSAPLWKLVALQCGLDPDIVSYTTLFLNIGRAPRDAEWFYEQRLNLAVAHVMNGTLPSVFKADPVAKSDIQCATYASWADSLGQGNEVPPWFPRSAGLHSSSGGSGGGKHKWPWGSYETPLLRDLAMAGERWRLKIEGGTYDPTDSTTGPKSKDDMVPWLLSMGVLRDNAKAIARILNDPRIPPGPRRRKRPA